jgi:hypothetical protein
MTMSNLRKLVENMTREPVKIDLSLEEIQRYLQTEKNPRLIFQWAKIYIERTLEV